MWYNVHVHCFLLFGLDIEFVYLQVSIILYVWYETLQATIFPSLTLVLLLLLVCWPPLLGLICTIYSQKKILVSTCFDCGGFNREYIPGKQVLISRVAKLVHIYSPKQYTNCSEQVRSKYILFRSVWNNYRLSIWQNWSTQLSNSRYILWKCSIWTQMWTFTWT